MELGSVKAKKEGRLGFVSHMIGNKKISEGGIKMCDDTAPCDDGGRTCQGRCQRSGHSIQTAILLKARRQSMAVKSFG